MKTLLGKLRHGVTDAPGIPIAEVRTAFRNQIDKRSKLQGCGVERRTVEKILHTIRHRLLHRICLAQLLQTLAPYVNLRTWSYLGRTDIVARQAQGAGRNIVGRRGEKCKKSASGRICYDEPCIKISFRGCGI